MKKLIPFLLLLTACSAGDNSPAAKFHDRIADANAIHISINAGRGSGQILEYKELYITDYDSIAVLKNLLAAPIEVPSPCDPLLEITYLINEEELGTAVFSEGIGCSPLAISNGKDILYFKGNEKAYQLLSTIAEAGEEIKAL